MKTIIKLAGMILIIMSQSACRTNKFSNRQMNRSAALEQTDIRSRKQENKQYSRFNVITDSGGQVYKVTIFPTDTFQFSMQEGFTGKASKVEVSGSIRRLKRITDGTAFIVSKDRETNGTMIRKMEAKQLGNSKSVEKTSFNWGWLCVAAAIALFIVWIFQRFRKRSFG